MIALYQLLTVQSQALTCSMIVNSVIAECVEWTRPLSQHLTTVNSAV